MKRLLLILMLFFVVSMFGNTFDKNATVTDSQFATMQEAPPPQLFVVSQIQKSEVQRSLSDALSQSKCSSVFWSVSKCRVLTYYIYNSHLSTFAYTKDDDIGIVNKSESLSYFKSNNNYNFTNVKLYSWLNGIKLKC